MSAYSAAVNNSIESAICGTLDATFFSTIMQAIVSTDFATVMQPNNPTIGPA